MTQHPAVGIAIYSPEHWHQPLETQRHFLVAYVACVPYLVAVGKVQRIAVVPVAVRVADDAYLLHFAVNSMRRARYLPMMSNSRFTTVPFTMLWKLVNWWV